MHLNPTVKQSRSAFYKKVISNEVKTTFQRHSLAIPDKIMQYAVFSHFLKVTTPSESAVLSTEGSSSDQKEKNSLGALIYLFYQKKLNFCPTIETLIYPSRVTYVLSVRLLQRSHHDPFRLGPK